MLPLHLLHSKYFQWTLWERTWLSIIKSICDFRLFWGTQFRRSLKCSWSKTSSICTQTGMSYTLPGKQGDSKVKDWRVCGRHHPDTPQLHGHTRHLQPPTAPMSIERRMNDAQQPRSTPTFPSRKIIQCDPSTQVPKRDPSLGLLNGI